MQVRNVVQHSSFDVPDAAVSRPQSASSSGRDQQGRDAILCSRLKGHQSATTCALVTSDAGTSVCTILQGSDALARKMLEGGFPQVYDLGQRCNIALLRLRLAEIFSHLVFLLYAAYGQTFPNASKAAHLSLPLAGMDSLQKRLSVRQDTIRLRRIGVFMTTSALIAC